MNEDIQFLTMMADMDEKNDRVTSRKVTVSDTSGVYHYLEAYHPNEWTVEIKYQTIGDHVSVDDVLLPLTDDEIEAGVEATSVINLPGMLEWADETAQFYEDTQTL